MQVNFSGHSSRTSTPKPAANNAKAQQPTFAGSSDVASSNRANCCNPFSLIGSAAGAIGGLFSSVGGMLMGVVRAGLGAIGIHI